MKKDRCPQCKDILNLDGDGCCSNCGGGPFFPEDTAGQSLEKDTVVGRGEEYPASKPPDSQEPSGSGISVRLEYKHADLKAAQHGCLPLRLTNLGNHSLRKIGISAECTAFCNCKRPFSVEWDLDLGQGTYTETRDCDFDIIDKEGMYAVKIHGYYLDEKGNPFAFRGSFSILIRNPDADQPSVVFRNAAAGMVEEIQGYGNIIIEDGAAVDLGRIVQPSGKITSKWIETQIEEDLEKTTLLRERIHSSKRKLNLFESSGQHKSLSDKALLTIGDGDSPRKILIWVKGKCRIGRNPDDSDLVCINLPAGDNNNEKNLLISKQHFSLHVKRSKVMIKDLGSRNGTFLDGRRLTGSVPLENGQIISLANVLSLRYHDFRRLNETKEVNRALKNCRTVMDCSAGLSSLNLSMVREKAPIDSCLLLRQDNFKDRLEYLFLLKSATIGSSKYATVLIQHDTVSEQHARIQFFKGRYYFEDLNSENGTMVNGSALEPYDPVLLGRQALIKMGNVEIEFRVAGN